MSPIIVTKKTEDGFPDFSAPFLQRVPWEDSGGVWCIAEPPLGKICELTESEIAAIDPELRHDLRS